MGGGRVISYEIAHLGVIEKVIKIS
jgi:hypothetical protein